MAQISMADVCTSYHRDEDIEKEGIDVNGCRISIYKILSNQEGRFRFKPGKEFPEHQIGTGIVHNSGS